ncbi:MAG: YcjF family protein [Leptolyngbyaceae cyanobacterium CRU_2_3]|nr:YcjF family protein [Leptolyngbyaceae cyanobacterium CRU_2_3]
MAANYLCNPKASGTTLGTDVQTELNQVRRHRALPLIEQYQWIAGAAAFANPVASLDLLATATINAQLVVDLGAIYQQQFSLEQAKTVMGNLAGQMVKLGLVEMASQAIAPLLKSHALTYVAGGTLQGISAAYLTQIAGLSLVEYFEEQSLNPSVGSNFKIDRWVEKLKAVFAANQRTEVLRSWVKQGMRRLAPESSRAATASQH